MYLAMFFSVFLLFDVRGSELGCRARVLLAGLQVFDVVGTAGTGSEVLSVGLPPGKR